MVCITRFSNLIAQSSLVRNLDLDHAINRLSFSRIRRSFCPISRTMMARNSNERDRVEDGGYVSGGWKSNNGRLSCGYSSFRGRRPSMEDFYDIKTSEIGGEKVNLFAVFDGHGGSRAAEYLKEHLFENLMKHPQFMTDTKTAISETYKKTDSEFLGAESNSVRDDGSTASTAVLIGRHLYVANVGDSRAVMLKAGKAIPLSDDHKPNRSDERKRIENAGGTITWAGTWRVGGVLAMSRAFGNRLLKQYVLAEPEIQEQLVDDDLELLVLASDGLWDVVPNEDAVSIANMEEPEAAALKLMETAFSRGSADNITCIVVRFHHEMMDVDSPCPDVFGPPHPSISHQSSGDPPAPLSGPARPRRRRLDVIVGGTSHPDPHPRTEDAGYFDSVDDAEGDADDRDYLPEDEEEWQDAEGDE